MKIRRTAACAAVGSVAFGLGLTGIFVPVLPATPFLILAALCLMHASPRLNAWFKKNPVYHRYFEDFIQYRAMTRRSKIKILVAASLMFAVAFLLLDPLWAKALIVVLVVVKYYYFFFCVWTIVETGHGIGADKDDDKRYSA